ncbi:DNA (cytosine-5-)-methyltransferase [Bradyrhizobium sp. NP1]|uniref:DNA (cytosine-5-)-methyltransferase n=1 Tax=Bradyrhizobium sp. NP1 TaxID=3049772 RepID=UPI0025A575EB|nr:DNA (cytosine-5-)-methyltransferase [Bradyrhizobium sp. NP1]WJR78520.1 DNA (cytosine-5-)-methyltransferase [Bradyrhizobium sp. NP1]
MARSHHSVEFEELRLKTGLSRSETANLLGVTERTIIRYENGESRPSPIAIKWLQEHLAKLPEKRPKPAAFKFIDLFAGIGGLRLGFDAIRGQCVFTSEWDKYSQMTYRENFGSDHPIAGDIREFSKDPSLIPAHDVLLAGFPCQPFSIAGVSKKNALGRPHGFLCDTQGTLFFDLAQIIAYHQPSAFLLENVKNLQRHDKGRTFATIVNVLRNELGYEVHHRVISSAPWVPQKRERIFIVGFRKSSKFDFDQLPVPEEGPKLRSILDPNESVDPKYTLTAHLWNYLKDYKEKHQAKGNGFGYSLFGPGDVARTLSARYFKDGSEVLIAQSNKRPRRLTPRECARLMGFQHVDGSDYRIPVSDTQAYKQFGNAVVVPVVKAVAELMKPHILAAVEHRAIKKPARQPELPFVREKDQAFVYG